jgi:hypothetical protein
MSTFSDYHGPEVNPADVPDCDPPDYEPDEDYDPTEEPGYAEWHARQWKPITHACGHTLPRYAPSWVHEENMKARPCPQCACPWCGEKPCGCADPFAEDVH